MAQEDKYKSLRFDGLIALGAALVATAFLGQVDAARALFGGGLAAAAAETAAGEVVFFAFIQAFKQRGTGT